MPEDQDLNQAEQPTGTEDMPIVVKPEKPFEKPQDLITWEFADRVFEKRSPVWLVSMLVVAVGALLILVLLQQWTLMLALVAMVFVFTVVNLVEPKRRQFTITTIGVKYGEQHYGYEDMKWFWLEENDGKQTLFISMYLNFPHVLEVELPEKLESGFVEAIEESLLKYIPYHEEKRRTVLTFVDKAIEKVSPWMPRFLVNWYSKKVG